MRVRLVSSYNLSRNRLLATKKKKVQPSVAQLQLVYDGPEVKDGTLRIEDMVDALIGFGRAYDKIADLQNVPVKQNLRVTGIKRASADILISAFSQMNPTVCRTSSVLSHQRQSEFPTDVASSCSPSLPEMLLLAGPERSPVGAERRA